MKKVKFIRIFCLLAVVLISVNSAFADSVIVEYSGHWYQRIDTNMSWHDAKTYAENLGGYLSVVTSQNENDFLWNNLAKDTGAFIWLGGTDEAQEGVWKWITGDTFWIGNASGSPVDGAYTNWTLDNPSDTGRGQDYLAFFPSYHANNKWDDFGLPDYNHLVSSMVEWNYNPTVVPEPISSILFIIGGAVLAGRKYLRRRK